MAFLRTKSKIGWIAIHLGITDHYFESGRTMGINDAVTTQAFRNLAQLNVQNCLTYATDEDPSVTKVDHPSVKSCLDREFGDWRKWLTLLGGYTYDPFIIRWTNFVHGAAPSCIVSHLKCSPIGEGNEPELTPRTHSPSPSRTDNTNRTKSFFSITSFGHPLST